MAEDTERLHFLEWPHGALGCRTRGRSLTGIRFLAALPDDVGQAQDHPAVRAIKAWLEQGGELAPDASWQLEPSGTRFQQRVWRALREIPPGQTRTYADLAGELGSGPRAVAGACRRNPVPLVIPCHRVVARQGLGGFSGQTSGPAIEMKRWLLAREGALS